MPTATVADGADVGWRAQDGSSILCVENTKRDVSLVNVYVLAGHFGLKQDRNLQFVVVIVTLVLRV